MQLLPLSSIIDQKNASFDYLFLVIGALSASSSQESRVLTRDTIVQTARNCGFCRSYQVFHTPPPDIEKHTITFFERQSISEVEIEPSVRDLHDSVGYLSSLTITKQLSDIGYISLNALEQERLSNLLEKERATFGEPRPKLPAKPNFRAMPDPSVGFEVHGRVDTDLLCNSLYQGVRKLVLIKIDDLL